MAGVNKAIIIGNLGNIPEVRYTPGGSAVTTISVATSEKWKDPEKGEQERTEWHRIVFFGRLAEIAGEYLKKGSKVYVEGRIQTRKWQDKDGQDRYTTEIVAGAMQMLDSRGGAPATNSEERSNAKNTSPNKEASNKEQAISSVEEFEDDIPF